jgi:hypothetical protein
MSNYQSDVLRNDFCRAVAYVHHDERVSTVYEQRNADYCAPYMFMGQNECTSWELNPAEVSAKKVY